MLLRVACQTCVLCCSGMHSPMCIADSRGAFSSRGSHCKLAQLSGELSEMLLTSNLSRMVFYCRGQFCFEPYMTSKLGCISLVVCKPQIEPLRHALQALLLRVAC